MSECHSVGSHLDTVCPSNIKISLWDFYLVIKPVLGLFMRHDAYFMGPYLANLLKREWICSPFHAPKPTSATCSTCSNDSPIQLKLIYQYTKTNKPRKF